MSTKLIQYQNPALAYSLQGMQLRSIQLSCSEIRPELLMELPFPPWLKERDFTADGKQGSRRMIRLIAVAGFLAVATSAQAMSPAPIPQPDGMITQVRLGCGPFRTRVNGVCVARTTIRHTRRMARRAYRRGTLPQ